MEYVESNINLEPSDSNKQTNHDDKKHCYKRDALKLVLFGIVGLLGVQYSYFAAIRYGNAAKRVPGQIN